MQNEYRNVYQRNRHEIDLNPDRRLIREMVDAGIYVIVNLRPAYCPTTDGYLGELETFVAGYVNFLRASRTLTDLQDNAFESDGDYRMIHASDA